MTRTPLLTKWTVGSRLVFSVENSFDQTKVSERRYSEVESHRVSVEDFISKDESKRNQKFKRVHRVLIQEEHLLLFLCPLFLGVDDIYSWFRITQ